MSEVKQLKIEISKYIFDCKELIVEYYNEQLRSNGNKAIILKNRLELKTQLKELNEYIHILVQNFHYGDLLMNSELLEDKYNRKLYNKNRINFQVILINTLELLYQFNEELDRVIPENNLSEKLNNLMGSILDKNFELLIASQRLINLLDLDLEYKNDLLESYYTEDLMNLINFIRIKEHGGGYVPSYYLNQYIAIMEKDLKIIKEKSIINKIKSHIIKSKSFKEKIIDYLFPNKLKGVGDNEIKGSIWQYIIPGGLIPYKISNNLSDKCNYLILDLYTKDFNGNYTIYNDITDNLLRQLSIASTTIRNAIFKTSNDAFQITINDKLKDRKALKKFDKMINDYKSELIKRMEEGIKRGNNGVENITNNIKYNIEDSNSISIKENSINYPFVVISELSKDKYIIYSDNNDKILFENLYKIPLINRIMKLAKSIKSKEWVKKVLNRYDSDNKILLNSNVLDWDIKEKNSNINKYHTIIENNYNKLISKYDDIPIEDKSPKLLDEEFLNSINYHLNVYEKCVSYIISNNPNNSLIKNIPKTVKSPALNTVLSMNNLEWYKRIIIDTLINHKMQIMILKHKLINMYGTKNYLLLESILNALHKCVKNCINNIYALNLGKEKIGA